MLKKLFSFAFLSVCLIGTLLALTVFIYTEVVYSPPLPDDHIELTKMMEEEKNNSIPQTFKMKKMTVNLRSRTSKLRFLDVEIHIIPFFTSQNNFLKKNQSILYDAIIDITSHMPPEQLNTVSGKLLLENRIRTTINRLLNKKIIKEILFTTFVII